MPDTWCRKCGKSPRDAEFAGTRWWRCTPCARAEARDIRLRGVAERHRIRLEKETQRSPEIRAPAYADRTIAELAYAAGIVDGEGCISVNASDSPTRSNAACCLRVYVVNTDEGLIDWFIAKFGGRKREIPQSERDMSSFHSKQITWTWALRCSGDVAEFLTAILPYVRVKKKQCALGVAFAKRLANWRAHVEWQTTTDRNGRTMPLRRVRASEVEIRRKFWRKMKSLNSGRYTAIKLT